MALGMQNAAFGPFFWVQGPIAKILTLDQSLKKHGHSKCMNRESRFLEEETYHL